jgi:hypothetical protein
MNIMKITSFLIAAACSLFIANTAGAQGMAINTSGAAAANSAILDVSSTTQGVLVPRMTVAQRNLISAPDTSLLIYQTDDTAGFRYYNGSVWSSLTGNTTGNSITTFTNISSNTYTISTADQVIYSTNSSPLFTLPTAANAGKGKIYHIIIGSVGASGFISVAPSSEDIIYAPVSYATGFAAMTVVGDGVHGWYVLSVQ